jgi:predicted ATPase
MQEDRYDPVRVAAARQRYVVISGCSGGGKSSLLDELAFRGHRTFTEPGREIIKEQTAIGRPNILDEAPQLFGELCVVRTIHRMIEAADGDAYVFFDRSHIDALSYCIRENIPTPAPWRRAAEVFRFNRKALMVPPWREIFRNDAERRHSFEEGLEEYPVLLETYRRLGYDTVIVPKAPVPERADFILRTLGKFVQDAREPSS